MHRNVLYFLRDKSYFTTLLQRGRASLDRLIWRCLLLFSLLFQTFTGDRLIAPPLPPGKRPFRTLLPQRWGGSPCTWGSTGCRNSRSWNRVQVARSMYDFHANIHFNVKNNHVSIWSEQICCMTFSHFFSNSKHIYRYQCRRTCVRAKLLRISLRKQLRQNILMNQLDFSLCRINFSHQNSVFTLWIWWSNRFPEIYLTTLASFSFSLPSKWRNILSDLEAL